MHVKYIQPCTYKCVNQQCFFHAFANSFAQFEYNEGIEVSTESDNFPLNIIMSMHMPRCLKKEVSQRYTMPPYIHLQKLNTCLDYMVWDLSRYFENCSR